MSKKTWRTRLNNAGNPFVACLLRSPAHRLLSGKVMLLTVRGRKTQREYTFPVEYKRSNGDILVASRAERTWWRNLRGGSGVSLLVHGQRQEGTATVHEPSAGTDEVTIRITPVGGDG